MASQFIQIPAPAGNGSGAAVDVSSFGATKTFVVSGSWVLTPQITIEFNNSANSADGGWQAIKTFTGSGKITVDVACMWIRVSVQNFRGGSAPIVHLGGDDAGTDLVNLPMPTGNASGAGVDTAAIGLFKTVQVAGPFRGSVIVEISTDGGATWGQQFAFTSPGAQSAVFSADFMRVSRNGVPLVNPGSPVCNVGACDLGGGGGQVGINLEQDGVAVTGGPFLTLDFIGATVADEGGATGSITIAATGIELPLINSELTTVVAGTPVYVSSAGHFLKAKADAVATGRTIGVTKADIASGVSGKVVLDGAIVLTTAQWDAICGTSGGLAYNVPYYLSAATAGALTPTPPNVSGQVVEQVIIGVSPTVAVVKIADPDVLGAGNNTIFLTNNNAGSILICQPVYSSAAAGCDLAIANNTGKGTVIGLVAQATIAPGARGQIVTGGLMIATTAQWDAICGTSGGLAFNTTYYLSWTVAGKMQATPPVSPTNDGNQVVLLIEGLSATEARITIQPPILL